LGALLFALVVESIEFPPVAYQRPSRDTRAVDDIRLIWKSAAFRSGVAALAVYSAGMSCLWGSTGRYARHLLDAPPAGGWIVFQMVAWSLLAAGRISGTLLMGRIDPIRLFAVFAASASVLCMVPAFSDSFAGLGCMLGASFFISILFPTVFADAVKDLGTQTPMGAGLLVAGAGFGAFAGMLVMRTLAGTAGSVHAGLAVAALGFGLLPLYALKRKAAAAA
jgi:FHS family L-fucose permease-like MFS transporter